MRGLKIYIHSFVYLCFVQVEFAQSDRQYIRNGKTNYFTSKIMQRLKWSIGRPFQRIRIILKPYIISGNGFANAAEGLCSNFPLFQKSGKIGNE